MHSVKLSPQLTVAAQPDIEDFARLAAEGYVALINNRPDFEDPTQPGSAAEAEAAASAGLAYAHIPVVGASFTEADIRAFQNLLSDAKGPVFAHCRSGTRTLNLWAAGEVLDGRMMVEDLAPLSRQTGLDLRGAAVWLAGHAKG